MRWGLLRRAEVADRCWQLWYTSVSKKGTELGAWCSGSTLVWAFKGMVMAHKYGFTLGGGVSVCPMRMWQRILSLKANIIWLGWTYIIEGPVASIFKTRFGFSLLQCDLTICLNRMCV